MKLEEFKSGKYVAQYEYKSFSPVRINQEWIWEDARINVLLENATRALGELNAFTQIVPDVDLFISMHIAKEANTSSKIEGTRTEIDEAVLPEEAVSPEKRNDWQEVQNYIRAMNAAVKELESIPLSMRLLKSTHAILLSGTRGMHKTPGEFRRSQNWIGGNSPADAAFVPPHQDELPDLLSDLEKFWHNNAVNVPHLIKCAISHYQFETIHPFQDGNGRIGRLMIPLYLISYKLLTKPSLYISAYLEHNRAEYYSALDQVRKGNDLAGWCRFFLQALISTAENGKLTFKKIMKLKEDMESLCCSMGNKCANAQRIIHHLYQEPFITVNQAKDILKVSFPTAKKIINELVEKGVLMPYMKQARTNVFFFPRYMDIFSDIPKQS